jgi:hypothetical protein
MTYVNVALATLCVLLCQSALAVDDEPTSKCPIPKGCRGNTIDATCAVIACKAKGCDGYGSGTCKDLKDLHDAGQCSLASDGCGSTLPRIRSGRPGIGLPQGPAKDVPKKKQPTAGAGSKAADEAASQVKR